MDIREDLLFSLDIKGGFLHSIDFREGLLLSMYECMAVVSSINENSKNYEYIVVQA